MAKPKTACLDDIVKPSGSTFSFDIDELSVLSCLAQSNEYVASILTDLSKVDSEDILELSLCLEHHVSSSLLSGSGFHRPPEDAGIEIFFQTEEQKTLLEKYNEECNKYLLAPVAAVQRCLEGGLVADKEIRLNLKNYGLDSLGIYLISQVMTGPPVVPITHLDLSNSTLEYIGCVALTEWLQQTSSLTHLNLSGCPLGKKGAEILYDGIEISQSLTNLNLSKCQLSDSGGALVVKAITYNENCKAVDISFNSLAHLTVAEIMILFKENRTLDTLNLKWNEFIIEHETIIPLFKALRLNENLKGLNLSWNGISGKGFARFMLRAVKAHPTLQKLDLSNNRISQIQLKSIIKLIKISSSLQELYLGGNIWSGADLFDLIKSVTGEVTLKLLDLGEFTWIPQSAYILAKQIMESKPDLKIIFKGQILPNPPDPVDFKAIIIDRAKYLAMAPKKKKLKRDMGHFMINAMDAEKTHYRKESFEDLLKKFKAKLDSDLVGHLGGEFTEKIRLAKKRTGKRIALKELAKTYLDRYPTERPPPPPPKKKRGKKGKKGKKTK